MVKIRVHGRGGEGAVTFAHMLCAAVTYDGKYGQSSMGAGFERRGAPVEAYARISDKLVAERGAIIDPDIVVVMNPALVSVVDVETGMVEGGKLVVNASKPLGLKHEATYVNARRIALEILRMPIPNTVMLGAFAASTGLVSLASLEECVSQMLGWLSQEKRKANIQAIRAGYEEVKHG